MLIFHIGFLICTCLSFIYTLLLLHVFEWGCSHMVCYSERTHEKFSFLPSPLVILFSSPEVLPSFLTKKINMYIYFKNIYVYLYIKLHVCVCVHISLLPLPKASPSRAQPELTYSQLPHFRVSDHALPPVCPSFPPRNLSFCSTSLLTFYHLWYPASSLEPRTVKSHPDAS